MDVLKKKWKKNVIAKGLMKRSKSINQKSSAVDSTQLSKSRSCGSSSPAINAAYQSYPLPFKPKKQGTARVPPGCFPVYVGPERVRFVVNTKHASHPLFVMLLEDAEVEYGYTTDGPLVLPCDEDLFYKVLAEMESEKIDEWVQTNGNGCGMAASVLHRGYSPLTPSRSLLKVNGFKLMA